ncbi:MAG: ABC transporter permease [Candidatus Bathyarchaeota archaeon]|nr:ABC transporter permease [Candidatus Bathyarchaeota archaeon]
MKAQRVQALTKKELLRVIREPANLFLVFLFPLILTLAFGVAFGAIGTGGDIQYSVAVIDLDSTSWSEGLVAELYNSGVLVPTPYTDAVTAHSDLQQGRVSAVLTIPKGFGDSVEAFTANPGNPSAWPVSTLELSLDQGSMIVSSVVPSMIQQALSVSLYGEEALSPPSPVKIGAPLMVESVKLTQFDIMVPGMFSYAVIFLTMIVSQVFTEERQQGILKRIAVTPTTASDIFGAQIIANLLTGVVQIMVVFVASYVMGFRPLGGIGGVLTAFTITLLLVLCNVGFGLITATLAKSSGAATGLSFIFILPQMLLGSFVPAPESVARFVPSYYVTKTLTNVFLRGADVLSQSTILNIGILAVYSLSVIALGVVLYSRYGNR